MLSVEALWLVRSVTGCHKLNTPYREPIPNTSNGRTYYILGYSFAGSFSGAKPEKTVIDSGKDLLKIYYDHSQNVNAMTRINEIRLREEKLNALELTENLELFQAVKTTQNRAQIQTRSICLRTVFLQIKISILLHLSSLRDNYSQKSYRLPEEKHGRSSLLVPTMTTLTALF